MFKKKRTPLKGMPFSHLTDEKLKAYIPMFQDFIFCFRHEDKEKEKMLQEIWKMLTNEEIDRRIWLREEEEKELERQRERERERMSEPEKPKSTGVRIKKRPMIKRR